MTRTECERCSGSGGGWGYEGPNEVAYPGGCSDCRGRGWVETEDDDETEE